MAGQLELLASIYQDEDAAQTVLGGLERMHKAHTITLADATVVTKDGEGKLHVNETSEVTPGKGAFRGALAAGAFGLLFPPALIASAVAGGIVGAVWGKLRDTGVKSSTMKDLGESLEPGNAAVIALAEPQYHQQIMHTMNAYESKFLRHDLSAKEVEQIEAAIVEAEESTGA